MDVTGSPEYSEIDPGSDAGRSLLRSVAARYGEGVAQASYITKRLFQLRSPWAPGLCFVGGETAASRDAWGNPLSSLSLGGTGETLEEALTSCLGEGIERLAHYERPGDMCWLARLSEVQDQVMPELLPAIAHELARAPTPAEPLAWVKGCTLQKEFPDLKGATALIPADWSLRRPADRNGLRPPASLYSGVAAGPNWEFAASRALLELIERDAASLWWIGGRRGRPIALDDPGQPELVRFLATLREGARQRRTWLLDITTDIAIPAIAALSCAAADGREIACGIAARTCVVAAARAALLELCQMELAILLARTKLAYRGHEGITALEERHLARATLLDADECHLLHPLGTPARHPVSEGSRPLDVVASALANAGIAAALIDLTREMSGLRVARAVAPQLQPMPSDTVTPRLQGAITAAGGGAALTGGVALM
jgi:ribosomal protein S12 methylthiotransferase accessory factor